jgi:SAM-dependent methyltransferase
MSKASTHHSEEDKILEAARYENRAREVLKEAQQNLFAHERLFLGSLSIPLSLRSPYTFYEKQIRDNMCENFNVLEIGSGIGVHTNILFEAGALLVTATDISETSLEVLKSYYGKDTRLRTQVVDLESLPFSDESFDMVASAGSLSYGDNKRVMMEIYRVLKPRRGLFICVDSLNHNPVYRFNRWVHYRRGNRTLSTLRRMPRLETIDRYRLQFGSVQVKFFGSISWLTPVFVRLLGETKFSSLSDRVDNYFGVKKAAFKFVMTVRKEL